MTTEERMDAEYYDADTGFLVSQNRHCEGENGIPPFELLRRKVSVPRLDAVKSKRHDTSDVSSQL